MAGAPTDGPAVWLSLERLRRLPLTTEARLALLQELRASEQPGQVALAVRAELAELTLRCCENSCEQGAWLAALNQHDALIELVDVLARAVPQQADTYWRRYGELLCTLTAAVHTAVNSTSTSPPEQPLRAELCWRLAQRLRLASDLPWQPPDWLAVLEQQLVQDGALFFKDLLQQGPDQDGRRRKAFHLFVRLEQLLDPAPVWVLQGAKEIIGSLAANLNSDDSLPGSETLELIELVESFPVDAQRQQALQAATTRARLTLELLDPDLGPLVQAPVAVEGEGEMAAEAAVPLEPATAELVFLDAGESASQLQLDVAPLLISDFETIEAALDDFVWHLPRGSRALPAAQALVAALEPRWRQGVRLPAEAFERLAYLAAAWQRRLAEKMEPLPEIDWHHSLLIELGATELAVLIPLLAAPANLEQVLAELRREHHNPLFWQQRQELPWMQCPPPLEALRRLHVEEGYYARGHEPLQGLQAWGGESALALLEADLWTDDAGCLGLWLAVAQELAGRNQGPLPPLGSPPQADQLLTELAGLEVLYVGADAAAVKEAHRAGRCFRGEPFGLRVLEPPLSHWPARPGGSFDESLAVLLEAVDGSYRQRPFSVLMADCGAYRLPLLRRVHQRYGVAALSSGRPMVSWLGA